MKKLMTLVMLISLMLFVTENVQAQNWKDAVNAAKKVKKNKTQKKGSTTKKTEVKENNSAGNNTQPKEIKKEEKTKSLPALTFDSGNPTVISYKSFFKSLSLEMTSGKIKLGQLSIKNLPEAEYGQYENQHKITAVLKSGKKTLKKFPFNSVNKNYSLPGWHYISSSETYTVHEAGNYVMEFQIDEKTFDKIDLNIVQVMSANNVSGYFIHKPLNNLGFFGAKSSTKGIPSPDSYFIFRFYTGVLDPDGAKTKNPKFILRLMRVNPNGSDIYIGGAEEISLKYWEKKLYETDNYFFQNSDRRNISYKDVSETDGDYYIDMIKGDEHYRYSFKMKDKKIVAKLSDRGTAGFVCAEAEPLEVIKYDGYRKTLPTAGIKDNVGFSIKSLDGKTTQGGYGAGKKAVIFTDGQKIRNSTIYLKGEQEKKYNYQYVELVTTMKKGNEIIAQDILTTVQSGSGLTFSQLISNYEGGLLRNESEAFQFMETLAKLPAGSHNLKLIYEIVLDGKAEIVGVQNITFKSKNGNPKFTKWAETAKQRSTMSQTELSEISFLASGSNDWVYYENNCGTIVWLRQDSYKEYHIYSGETGKLDRSKGYFEQWNFHTLEWRNIDDVGSYKTIYKMGQNDIAIMQMKLVPKEAIEKFKTIQDVEFKTEEAFFKKIDSLIGKELREKHENLIAEQCSYDYVKICK